MKKHVKGFTLIEIVVTTAIFGILAASLVPLSIQEFQARRERATLTEMKQIYRAIVGEPARLNFGYAGDMGKLPDTLTDLNTQGIRPSYTTSTTNGIGMGWRGPYINVGRELGSYLKDAWGNNYRYGFVGDPGNDNTWGTADDVQGLDNGGINTGIIQSAGPDGVFASTSAVRNGTADDIIYPSRKVDINGDFQATVWFKRGVQDWLIDPIPDAEAGTTITVQVFYPNNGIETSLSDTNGPPYAFTDIPAGPRAFSVSFLDEDGNTHGSTVNETSIANDTTFVDIYLN
ncbi:MAG: prepilin-type N-terminal cleavage/methylation domain-containing protein [Candidatus Brocadiales bacterium]|nr:prepilin-type N-terminal cleavage/methylation domain-containing protein [Candidatus Brocadiales bacterium]